MNEHNLNEHNFKEETLHLIREVEENSSLNQRLLSQRLNISLGKTNYLLKELVKKGFIKVVSFSRKPEKTQKVRYILTQRGMKRMAELTYHFLRAKEKDYKRLKEEYERIISGGNNVK